MHQLSTLFEQDRPNFLPSHLKTFCETSSAPVFGLFPSSYRKTFQGLKGSLATCFITAGMQHKPLVQMRVGLVSMLDFWGVSPGNHMGFLIKDSCGITRLSVETDSLPWHHGRLPFLGTATVSTTHNPRPVTRILPILRNYIHLPTAKKQKHTKTISKEKCLYNPSSYHPQPLQSFTKKFPYL